MSEPNYAYKPLDEAPSPPREGSELPLASRGKRLGAYLLEFLFFSVALVPGYVVGLQSLSQYGGWTWEILAAPLVLLSIVAFLALVVVNFVLIYRYGASIGKHILKLRIDRYDSNERASFSRIVWMRGFLASLPGAIPYVGNIYTLADVLFIFGQERRCLHDQIAGTRVVDLRAAPEPQPTPTSVAL